LHQTARRALAAEALQNASHAYDRGRTASVDTEAFVDFALATFSEARALPQWRALERRRKVGTRFAPIVPGFAASVIWRRARRELRYRRWIRAGV
jgi:hypothetical protein